MRSTGGRALSGKRRTGPAREKERRFSRRDSDQRASSTTWEDIRACAQTKTRRQNREKEIANL